MKTRYFVFVISVLFVMGLSGNVFAASDSTGEALTAGVDRSDLIKTFQQ